MSETSYSERAKKWWANSRANTKTWTIEQWIQDRWEMRLFMAFTGGVSLGLILSHAAWLLVILMILISWPLIERDYRRKIKEMEAA